MVFEMVKLGEIFNIQIGKTPSRDNLDYWRNGVYDWLSISDLNQGKYLSQSKEKISQNAVFDSKIKLIPENTVLLSYKLSIGKVGITTKPLYTNEAIAGLIPLQNNTDINYIYWVLQYIDLLADADRAAKGKTLNKEKLKQIQIPLPPLPTQIHIAKILDKADELRQNRKIAIAKLDELLQATFVKMFGDPVVNDKGWDWGTLEILGKIDRGVSKHRPRNDPALLGGNHPLIQTGDVANSQGYIKKYKATYSDLGLAQSKKWQKGTLCITIAANIANTGILTFDACFPDSVVGFVPNQNSNVEFVQGLFMFFGKILEENAPQSAQKNINLKILKELKIPIPPTELQTQFAQIAQNIESQKSKFQAQLAELDTLFLALEQKAFDGGFISHELSA